MHAQIAQTNMSDQKEDELWSALEHRDHTWNGRFFFGVTSTGVYCRPGCPSRTPLRSNVRFFATGIQAESAGFRPCRRCRPEASSANIAETERVQAICAHIRAHPEHEFTLAELAQRAGLSSFHLQRTFKAVTGVTPRQFAEGCRMKLLKLELRAQDSVTDAIYESGFGSSSRVYERADTRLGMTPAQYRAGGRSVAISYVSVDSALGRMMIGATDRGLCFLQFAESDDHLLGMLRSEYPAARIDPMQQPYPAQFAAWMQALQDHLEGSRPKLDLPFDVRATAFQMKVWRYLQSIPYGSVQSYAEVAAALGQPGAARAVARACASNAVGLVIPCHRVIRASGELAGYRWGLERKRALIDGERRRSAPRNS